MKTLASRLLSLFLSDVPAGACIAPEPCTICRNHRRTWSDCRGRCTITKAC